MLNLNVLCLLVLTCVYHNVRAAGPGHPDAELFSKSDSKSNDIEEILRRFTNPEQINLVKCKQYHGNKKISGGRAADPGEFPHMAALGYGERENVKWDCGGTLINEEFILTAGHCLLSQQFGPVKFVRLGDYDLKSNSDDASAQEFTIKEEYPHPSYKRFAFYNDIALLQLSSKVKFIEGRVMPACFGLTNYSSDSEPVAAGWGVMRQGGNPSNILRAADMRYVSNEDCKITHPPSRKIVNGLDDATMICARGRTNETDTCQGDSGGPLQITSETEEFGPFPEVVGITSFGMDCGLVPGVYTRVYPYSSWIKKIVWPTAWNSSSLLEV